MTITFSQNDFLVVSPREFNELLKAQYRVADTAERNQRIDENDTFEKWDVAAKQWVKVPMKAAVDAYLTEYQKKFVEIPNAGAVQKMFFFALSEQHVNNTMEACDDRHAGTHNDALLTYCPVDVNNAAQVSSFYNAQNALIDAQQVSFSAASGPTDNAKQEGRLSYLYGISASRAQIPAFLDQENYLKYQGVIDELKGHARDLQKLAVKAEPHLSELATLHLTDMALSYNRDWKMALQEVARLNNGKLKSFMTNLDRLMNAASLKPEDVKKLTEAVQKDLAALQQVLQSEKTDKFERFLLERIISQLELNVLPFALDAYQKLLKDEPKLSPKAQPEQALREFVEKPRASPRCLPYNNMVGNNQACS